jgi:hypothetical protein
VGLGTTLLTGQHIRGFGPVGSLLAVALWLTLWTLATVGAGRAFIDWCRAEPSRSNEDFALACVTGSAVLAGASVLLSAAGWFRPGPLLGLLAAAAVLGGFELARRPPQPPPIERRVVGLATLWLIALVIAATVTTFYDQWHQHLGFPWLWLQEGSIHVIPRNFYSYMPVNSSLMYAFGIGTLGAWSAQAVHWWSGVVTVLICGLLGRRVVADGGGWWAVLFVATTPNVVHLAASGGSDLVVTMFAAGAWLALLKTTDDDPHPVRWWLLAGGLAGMAAGTKYTALGTVVLPLAAGGIVLHRPWLASARTGFLRGSGAATLGGIVTFGPWVIRNLAATGAPLFPFLTGPFQNWIKVDREALAAFAAELSGFELDLAHVVDGIGLGTVTSPVGGFAPAGLLWLGAAAATLIVIPRMGRTAAALAVGGLVGIFFWIIGLQVVRYLLPALVPLAAVFGGGVATAVRTATPPARRAVAVLVAVAVAWNLTTMLHPVGFQRLGCSLGVNPVQPLLERWVSSSLAFDAVRELPADARILLVAESRAFGFERAVELENPYPFGDTRLESLARTHPSPDSMAAELAADGITHVLTNRWEARRMAGMIRRGRYFNCGDDEVLSRIDAFARSCLHPVWLGHGVSIYRLDPSCGSTGAGDLATW